GLCPRPRGGPQADTLLPFLTYNQFRSILARVEPRLAKAATGALKPTEATPAPAPVKETRPPAKPKGSQAHVLVQDAATLADWIDRARSAGVVAFDTETTSLDTMRAELVGFSLALEPGVACYVPLGHKTGGDLLGGEALVANQIPAAEALVLLKPLLEDDSVLKVGQNVKYDMEIMARLGIALAGYDDSML